ncbi:MAG TPA: hypothetical protein VH084_29985 [Mycobacterium sp.]|nr:hypothetical protein [Mycobacterium sp.]
MIEGLNIPNFRKTLEIMAADPRLVDMDTWWKTTACGTTACLAGHAAELVGDRVEGLGNVGFIEINGQFESVEFTAANVLGLSSTRLRNAFFYRPAALKGREAVAVLYQMAEVVSDGDIRMPPEFDDDYLRVAGWLDEDPPSDYRGDPAMYYLSEVPEVAQPPQT